MSKFFIGFFGLLLVNSIYLITMSIYQKRGLKWHIRSYGWTLLSDLAKLRNFMRSHGRENYFWLFALGELLIAALSTFMLFNGIFSELE